MSQKIILVTACGAEREIEMPDDFRAPEFVVPIRRWPQRYAPPSMESNYIKRVFLLYGQDRTGAYVYQERVE